MTARCGLALLTGGRGARLGGPKHGRPHPEGGSWGGHLVRVFRAVVADGPIRVLGEPLPEWPDLPRADDLRHGPAVALRAWAGSSLPPARRWWVVACDQVRWTPEAFAAWLAEAEAADPDGAAWVFTLRDGHRQQLGGCLGGQALAALARSGATSLQGLLADVPAEIAAGRTWFGEDIDTPEDLARLIPPRARPARP